jgi:hypothetical protein
MELLSASWHEISEDTIESANETNNFSETLQNENNVWDLYIERVDINNIAFYDYVNVDESLEVEKTINERIIANLLNQNTNNSELSESTDEEMQIISEELEENDVSFSDAIKALDTFKRFISTNNFKDKVSENISFLENELLDFNMDINNVENKITDFFK